MTGADQRSAERPDGMPPTVAVVIATRDRPELLRDTLRAVLAGDHRPREIVVVDQSTRAAELDDLEWGSTRLRYILSTERGLSRGRNAGIRATGCDILAFLDDDVLPQADWLSGLVAVLIERGPRCIVTGSVMAGDPEQPGGFAPSIKAHAQRVTYRGRPAKDPLSPNNMALYRQVFREVGLFDVRLGAGSTYPSSEDNDLCFRLLETGHEIEYVPDIRVYHRAWRAPDARVPLAWSYGVGQGAYWAKYFSLRDPYMLRRAWDDAVRHAWRAVVTIRRNRPSATADLAYVSGMLAGATGWLVRERRLRRPLGNPRSAPARQPDQRP